MQVQTVLGPIAPDKLGITAMHEHLIFGMPGWDLARRDSFDGSAAYEKAFQDLTEFKRLGGQTVVDCTCWSMGRDVEFYQVLSRKTGVNIIVCTGLRDEYMMPGKLFGDSEDIDYISGLFRRELTDGAIVGWMRRCEAKAGLVEAGNSRDQITKAEKNLYRAAARAASQTGAAVTTTGPAMALRQLEILTSEGLSPTRVVIGHCDQLLGLERDRAIAEQRAFVAYDSAAHGNGTSEKSRVAAIKAMVSAGLEQQVIISCNAISYGLDYPSSPRPLSYLLNGYVPALREAGITEEAINTILVENPKRVLAH